VAEVARVAAPVLRVAVRTPVLAEIVRALGHVISDVAEADVVLDAAGAELPPHVTPEQIDAALRAAAAGLVVRPRESSRFAAVDETEAPSPLSPRELEILIALADGLSNKQVARRFDISQHAVKFHIESIFRKLGVATRAEAVAKGLRRGLVHL
jgi:DNA-binding NarL/FixJ family response regulator